MPSATRHSTVSRASLSEARRLVVKAGTQVLLGKDGHPALGRFFALVESLASLRRAGRDVILVSSGAVGLGAQRLGLGPGPRSLALKQACAAVGQGELMGLYQEGFGRLGVTCAQVLLVEDDFADPVRRHNLRTALEKLLELGVVPIINENDTVSTLELERPGEGGAKRIFGDNDKLSALVAVGLQAEALLILSDVEGLYEADPRKHPGAALLREVSELSPEILALGGGAGERGRGGMITKLEAARLGTEAGVAVLIASGDRPGVVGEVLSGGEVGTLFLPRPRPKGDPLEAWLHREVEA